MSKRHVRRNVGQPTEFAEQATLIEWWSLSCRKYGLPPLSLLAIPNGAHLAGDIRGRAIKMANLKRTGLRPGVPDLFLAKPIVKVHQSASCRYLETVAHGLWIEMKRKPNKPSEDQERVIFYLRQRGYHVCICWSFEEAKRAIEGYLG